jgi:hypothetical protein
MRLSVCFLRICGGVAAQRLVYAIKPGFVPADDSELEGARNGSLAR